MEAKQQLRKDLRAARRAHAASLPEATRALILMRPPARVAEMVPEGSTVGLYYPLPEEAPALGWARWFHENGRRVALPWFAGRGSPMQFRLWANPFNEDALEGSFFGLTQPGDDAPEAVPDSLIVPLVGFTATCDRIGQGAGHYDRWLAAHPGTTTIGLAWDCQLVDSLPLEPHDQRLDAVVTPTRFYEGAA